MLVFFFFNDTATTEIYTLSLHDALPIWLKWPPFSSSRIAAKTVGESNVGRHNQSMVPSVPMSAAVCRSPIDRKSTRLNSSHANISYAVFCLKKKTQSVSIYSLHQTV